MAVSSKSVKLDAPVKGSSKCNFSRCSHGACEEGEQWQSALNVLRLMLQSKVQPNAICYNAAIHCEKGGLWETALNLLCSMHQSKVAPDVVSYRAAISACEKAVNCS
eukprot:TRINITY_DN13017_c0_g1_i5.p1 TRINITY_DN13017_c0_g1~~TRINITY_DN13017_c0_g1_i5.p1  ORF type:complete len:107 (+),score=14.28 TRINITY_DN13017_c0_g1_i5:153-473(+)